MNFLGLICARGGSKGIPRKNIKEMHGKPLIAWSIEAGLKSKRLDDVIVSTDDQEIADIAQSCGANVPFIRPSEHATDKALQIDAILHAINILEAGGKIYDYVVLLQPTCPMRTSSDVDTAIDILIKSEADTLISVTTAGGYHPVTMYQEEEDRTITPFIKSASGAGVLRQEFPPLWWRNGAIYILSTKILKDRHSLYGDRIAKYEMPADRSANIDEPIDWIITEALMKEMIKE